MTKNIDTSYDHDSYKFTEGTYDAISTNMNTNSANFSQHSSMFNNIGQNTEWTGEAGETSKSITEEIAKDLQTLAEMTESGGANFGKAETISEDAAAKALSEVNKAG